LDPTSFGKQYGILHHVFGLFSPVFHVSIVDLCFIFVSVAVFENNVFLTYHETGGSLLESRLIFNTCWLLILDLMFYYSCFYLSLQTLFFSLKEPFNSISSDCHWPKFKASHDLDNDGNTA